MSTFVNQSGKNLIITCGKLCVPRGDLIIGSSAAANATISSNGTQDCCGLSVGQTYTQYGGWDKQIHVHGNRHSHVQATTNCSAIKMGIFAHCNWGGAVIGAVGTNSNHIVSMIVNNTHVGCWTSSCLYHVGSVKTPILCASSYSRAPYYCVNGQSDIRPFSSDGVRGIQIRSGCTNGVAALELADNAGTWRSTLYATTNHYGFLDSSWGGWDIKKAVNGDMCVTVGSSGFLCVLEGGICSAAKICSISDICSGNAVYLSEWVRFNCNTRGLYWAGACQLHVYPAVANCPRLYIRSCIGNSGIAMTTCNNTTPRGYIYADCNSNMGFLDASHNWSIRHLHGSCTEFRISNAIQAVLRTNCFCHCHTICANSCLSAPTVMANGGNLTSFLQGCCNYRTFRVCGDADTFYPVCYFRGSGWGYKRYSINRSYNSHAPNTWYSSTHKGGLNYTWEQTSDTQWGGNDRSFRVNQIRETYTTVMGGHTHTVSGGIVWLRGGGADYCFFSDSFCTSCVCVYDGAGGTDAWGMGHSSCTYFCPGNCACACALTCANAQTCRNNTVCSTTAFPIQMQGTGNSSAALGCFCQINLTGNVNASGIVCGSCLYSTANICAISQIKGGRICSTATGTCAIVSAGGICVTSDWYRITGNGGLYFSSHAAGIHGGGTGVVCVYNNGSLCSNATSGWGLRSAGCILAGSCMQANCNVCVGGCVHACCGIVFTHSNWSGEKTKIQAHSCNLYFQNYNTGHFIFRNCGSCTIASINQAGCLTAASCVVSPVLCATTAVRGTEICSTNWLRNTTCANGIYNQSTCAHFYSAGANYWHINGTCTATSGGLVFYKAYNGSHGNLTNRRGYIYWDGTANFGLLTCAGNWGIRFEGDTNTCIHRRTFIGCCVCSPIVCGTSCVSSNSLVIGPTVCGTSCLKSGGPICLAPDSSGDMKNGITLGKLGGLPQAVWGESSSKTGRIEIGLPTLNGEGGSTHFGMVHVAVDIYEYNSNDATTIIVGGHNWNCRWFNCGAHITGGCTDKTIKVAYHACGGTCNGRYVILLGECDSTWTYGSVHVRSITNGLYYCNYMDMGTPWYVKRVTCADSYYNCTSADLRSTSNSMAGYQCAMTCFHGPRLCATTCVRTPTICATSGSYYLKLNSGTINVPTAYINTINNSGSTAVLNLSGGYTAACTCLQSPVVCATTCVKAFRGMFGGANHTCESNEAVIRMGNNCTIHQYISSCASSWGSWSQWVRYVGACNTWRIGAYDEACQSGTRVWRLGARNHSLGEVNYIVAGPSLASGTNRVALYCPYARDAVTWNGDGNHYPIGAGGIVCGATCVQSPVVCGTSFMNSGKFCSSSSFFCSNCACIHGTIKSTNCICAAQSICGCCIFSNNGARVMSYGTHYASSTDWDTIFNTAGQYGQVMHEIHNGTSWANSPGSSVYSYGGLLNWHGNGMKFQMYLPHTGSNGQGLYYRTNWSSNSWYGWARIWDSNNDGSGSGLDADLLDGQQGSHYLNAANLTGTVATARLGSGTASSSTYLRGDGTWAAVSSGSSLCGCTTALVTYLGCDAGANNEGCWNVAVGVCAMNAAGVQPTYRSYSTAVGDRALCQTGGSSNTMIGFSAGVCVCYNAASDNVAVGSNAGYCARNGAKNVFIGKQAGGNALYGCCNIAIGYLAHTGSFGCRNVIIAPEGCSAQCLANSCNNIVIGYKAAHQHYSYSNCTFIGNCFMCKMYLCAGTVCVCGSLSKTSGCFSIPHPNPAKTERYNLSHSFVESPTEGDNIYRYTVDTQDCRSIVELPDYYRYLNKNDQVWVSANRHFGVGYGEVTEDQKCLVICSCVEGSYNVLLIGTRKDKYASNWKGTETIAHDRIREAELEAKYGK